MKPVSLLMTLLAACAIVLAGCGKSEEERKMEADLNDQIMKGHDVQMAKMSQVNALIDEVNVAIAANDSLAKARPKETAGRSNAELTSTRDRLEASKDAMNSWMKGHQPYNEGIRHDQAVAQLKSDLDALNQVGQQMDTAIADATRVLNEQKSFVAGLAKPSRGRRGR